MLARTSVGWHSLERASDGNLVAIAALTLGCIERAVGALQQRLGGHRRSLAKRDADTRRHLQRLPSGEELATRRRDDLAGDEAAFLAAVNAFEHDDELVAGEPRDEIGRAHR